MICAWCGPASEESHGICDDCMRKLGIDPATIHAEIAKEDAERQEQERSSELKLVEVVQ